MNPLLCILIICIVSMTVAFSFYCNPSITFNCKGRTLEMKGKGKRVPINQRGEYLKQQRMLDLRQKMEKNKPEGVPVFKIFVRLKTGGLWIPAGDLAGDQRATALVNAWTSGFMTDMYKGQLDRGVAKSIFGQEDSFLGNIIENYPPFKKSKKEDLEIGYQVEFPGLEEKVGEQKVKVLDRSMQKDWLDNIKESVANVFKPSS